MVTADGEGSESQSTGSTVDQRRNKLEMCTCGRETCQALPPSALSLSCKAEKSYPEQRTCSHRIKSRVLNLIQGRDCKTKPRSVSKNANRTPVTVTSRKLQSHWNSTRGASASNPLGPSASLIMALFLG